LKQHRRDRCRRPAAIGLVRKSRAHSQETETTMNQRMLLIALAFAPLFACASQPQQLPAQPAAASSATTAAPEPIPMQTNAAAASEWNAAPTNGSPGIDAPK